MNYATHRCGPCCKAICLYTMPKDVVDGGKVRKAKFRITEGVREEVGYRKSPYLH